MAQMTTGQDWTVTHTRLFRAEQGIKPPTWETVRAYIEVCHGNTHKAQRLWTAATDAATSAAARPEPAPAARTVLPPEHISEPLELLHAMRAMRTARGYRSLRELEDAARVDGVSFLPRSTLGAILSGKRATSKETLLVLVVVCTGAEPDSGTVRAWSQAWDRVNAYRKGNPAQPALASVLAELREKDAELRRAREELARRTAPPAVAPADTDAYADVTIEVTDNNITSPAPARPSRSARAWHRIRALIGTPPRGSRPTPTTKILGPRPATSP
ncbi:hypothetical protein [Embleya sp. NPDC001921]